MSGQKPSHEVQLPLCNKTVARHRSEQEYKTISKALSVPSMIVKWKKFGTNFFRIHSFLQDAIFYHCGNRIYLCESIKTHGSTCITHFKMALLYSDNSSLFCNVDGKASAGVLYIFSQFNISAHRRTDNGHVIEVTTEKHFS